MNLDGASQNNRLKYNVVVLGGTPGGIASAIAAARGGSSVLLIEESPQLGGMSTSGLGKSDIENRSAIGGIFREFVDGVRNDYLDRFGPESPEFKACKDGYYFEPSVALRVFKAMLDSEPSVRILMRFLLKTASCADKRLRKISIENLQNGEVSIVEADAFIDATYEGDLLAAAGAEYRLGREGYDDFREPHAGVMYCDYNSGEILPGSTREADPRLPAYTYRLCLATDPKNMVPFDAPPEGYDRHEFLPYLDDLACGRFAPPTHFKEGWGYYPDHFDTMLRSLSVTKIPNAKTDVNINPRPLAFPFGEENIDYVEGSPEVRDRVRQRHRSLTLGLLYFLQNDPDISEEHRAMACQYGLPADEFVDNGHFPWQLYVREARRLVGEAILTEHDVTIDSHGEPASPVYDAIALGEFPIDSFPCRKREADHQVALEGYLSMLHKITRPYPISYRIMIPQSIDGLIVPVAASATHVAFSTIRMEPCWMAMGQAAGTAASLASQQNVELRALPIPTLQRRLAADGQVLAQDSAHPHFNMHNPRQLSGNPLAPKSADPF